MMNVDTGLYHCQATWLSWLQLRTFVFAEDLLGQALSECGCLNPALYCSGQLITSCLLEQNKQTKPKTQTNKQKTPIFFFSCPY